MKHYTALTLTLATACLSNSMPVAAADTELEEVTVYGTQLEETIPQMLEQYGNQLEIISAEQIRDGAFTDIADALRLLVPGLHISPKNGPFDYQPVEKAYMKYNSVNLRLRSTNARRD